MTRRRAPNRPPNEIWRRVRVPARLRRRRPDMSRADLWAGAPKLLVPCADGGHETIDNPWSWPADTLRRYRGRTVQIVGLRAERDDAGCWWWVATIEADAEVTRG